MLDVNDGYIDKEPLDQNALDLFSDAWASALPSPELKSGSSPLFDDARIHWLIEQRTGLQSVEILELGPLEAGHTYMMDRAGAKSILAIEANSLAYLRCLVVKEVLGIPSAHFMLGDFDKFLAHRSRKFDLLVASGVLYHLTDPLASLQNMVWAADEIFIWSHFFDDVAMPLGDPRRDAFTEETVKRNLNGDTMTYHVRSYGAAPKPKAFCGGIMSGSIWLEKRETVDFLESNGYAVTLSFEHDDHIHGPSACLYASRR